tara:strand:+ start:50 stop:442 length:393 start_codon:yes stop_codon:yes gene_type:complete
MLWFNHSMTDEIYLSCITQSINKRDDLNKLYDIEYEPTKPSRWSAVIEIVSPGKVIGRFIGSSETGNKWSPYVGTIDDIQIKMNHKLFKIDDRGIDFNLDLISGLYEENMYILDYPYWAMQYTGVCKITD